MLDVGNISRYILKIQNKKFCQKFVDDFLGEILGKIFQKVPHRFLGFFWPKKIV